MRTLGRVTTLALAMALLGPAACSQGPAEDISGSAIGENADVLTPVTDDTGAATAVADAPRIPKPIEEMPDPKAEARDAAGAGGDTDAGDASADSAAEVMAVDTHSYVRAHNRWRTDYGSDPVAWDNTIAAYAQEWADHLAAIDGFEHRQSSPYGENIYAGWGRTYGADDAVDSWGSEVRFWDLTCTGGINDCCQGGWDKCGHFTQVVWSTTTKIGCGKAISASRKQIIVCNYAPPGNMGDTSPFKGGRAGAPAPTAPAEEPTAVLPAPTTAPAQPTMVPVQPTTAPVQPTSPASQPPGGGTYSWWAAKNNLRLAIPDESSISYNIPVTREGTLSRLGLRVVIQHSYVGDIALVLAHPDGTSVILRNQVGGSGQNINDTYGMGGIPVSELEQFRGKPMAGNWQLTIHDLAAEDTGTFDSFRLDIEYTQ